MSQRHRRSWSRWCSLLVLAVAASAGCGENDGDPPSPAPRVVMLWDSHIANTGLAYAALRTGASVSFLGADSTFDGGSYYTGTGMATALANADVLVVSEVLNAYIATEFGNLTLRPEARAAIRAFCGAGGTILITGGEFYEHVNVIFDGEIALANGWNQQDWAPVLRSAGVVDSAFLAGPDTLVANRTTFGLDPESLPGGTALMYDGPVGHEGMPSVAVLSPPSCAGHGRIVYLGWNWHQSASNIEDGWGEVLRSVLRRR